MSGICSVKTCVVDGHHSVQLNAPYDYLFCGAKKNISKDALCMCVFINYKILIQNVSVTYVTLVP